MQKEEMRNVRKGLVPYEDIETSILLRAFLSGFFIFGKFDQKLVT